MMVKIMRDPNLHRLCLEDQKDLVNNFCEYLRQQIQDMRLREDRSNIRRKPFQGKNINFKTQESEHDEQSLYKVIYHFLFAFFRWESNFKESLLNAKYLSDEKKSQILQSQANSRRIIQQNSDQFVKMLF